MLKVNWLKIVRALFLQCISALPKKNVAKRELIFGLLLHWSTFALNVFFNVCFLPKVHFVVWTKWFCSFPETIQRCYYDTGQKLLNNL